MANESGIKIVNFNQVLRHISRLDPLDKGNIKESRKVLKKPFLQMRKLSRANLKSQKSEVSGNLYKGLSVGSKLSKAKGYMSIAFGGRSKAINKSKPSRKPKRGSSNKRGAVNHFHLVNSGTVRRYHRNWKSVGAVGKGESKRPNMNPSFRVGFADRAIKPILPTIQAHYERGFESIINRVKTKGT